ncbi:hypothetical protein LPB72_18325 [Hydrogenophaga crassostreae]|uniref:Type II secretion system protein H n=1 Tax=Hydrogenophaga crassostreae TaxID=1763535 RepID=A0A167H104_9BURK|nr:GspH/FimT family pseudopilin [Hydrogenophaga crassostreae]AOW12933.1 hypothetical protein LPB072_08830 [Hydrogenophaga crassostreae]OAD40118.1 hypothetical protein LPB72_18325 [Hydrogenophaga crassostreae]
MLKYNQKACTRSPLRGFTLVELLITMAVLAILLGLAVPTLGGMLAKWHRDSATRAIVSHLQLARAAAIKSTRRVIMCNSIDGTQCAEASQREWSSGWLVFQDDNTNKVLDADDTVIAVTGPLAGIASLRSSNGVRQFVFMPSGLMASGMSSLVVVPRTGHPMRIIINRIGRLRLSEDQT